MSGATLAIAIVVGLVCSFIQSLGLTIQRKSHVQDDAKPFDLRKRPIRRPLWVFGFVVYITSNIFGSVFQIGALPIVVLAPLGGVSLLWNSLLARVLLGEMFTSAMALGTFLIATGAILIAVFGVVPDDNHSLDELMMLWGRPSFVAFFTIVCTAVVVTLGFAHVVSWRICRRQHGRISLGGEETPPPSSLPPSNYASPYDPPPIPFKPTNSFRRWSASSTSSILESTTRQVPDAKVVRFAYVSDSPSPTTPVNLKVQTNCLTHQLIGGVQNNNEDEDDESGYGRGGNDGRTRNEPTSVEQRTLMLVGLAFAAVSGTLSGLCLVLAKSAVELLITTFEYWRTGHGENEFTRIQTWFLVFGLVIAAILQLIYLNHSLQFASPALICPLAFCFYNLASIFDGLIYYNQFDRLAMWKIMLVSLGVAILLVGIWVVSAIQPTGQGGIEVGTWVEDEALSETDHEALDELEAGEGATLLGGDSTAEPESFNQNLYQFQTENQSSSPTSTTTKTLGFSQTPRTPTIVESSIFSDPLGSIPYPRSPLSPTSSSRRPRSYYHRHHPRYGTLIPELAPAGAPTGFSFGIGAASPGFALRSSSINWGSGGSGSGGGGTGDVGVGAFPRFGRSRSEDHQSIQAVIRGRRRASAGAGLESSSRRNAREGISRVGSTSLSSDALTSTNVDGQVQLSSRIDVEAQENEMTNVEETMLRSWEQQEDQNVSVIPIWDLRRWFGRKDRDQGRKMKGKGKIRLSDDQ